MVLMIDLYLTHSAWILHPYHWIVQSTIFFIVMFNYHSKMTRLSQPCLFRSLYQRMTLLIGRQLAKATRMIVYPILVPITQISRMIDVSKSKWCDGRANRVLTKGIIALSRTIENDHQEIWTMLAIKCLTFWMIWLQEKTMTSIWMRWSAMCATNYMIGMLHIYVYM